MNAKVMRRLLFLFLVLVISFQAESRRNAAFDYYVLSLSWSPEYCNVRPEERQCGKGHGLVLHGLWPQYDKGYPESCSRERISKDLVKRYSGLFPSERLVYHEWRKHGTCSGLAPKEYLQLSEKLKLGFITPDSLNNLSKPLRISRNELSKLVLEANPKLNQDALSFSCAGNGRFLQEIYVCFDKDGGAAASCSPEMQRRSQRSCGRADMLVRNVR